MPFFPPLLFFSLGAGSLFLLYNLFPFSFCGVIVGVFFFLLYFLTFLTFLYSARSLYLSPFSFVSALYLGFAPLFFFLGFSRGLEGEVPLNNFSSYAFYKYFFYLLVVVFFLLLYLGSLWFSYSLYNPFPSVYEEFARFFLSFQESFFPRILSSWCSQLYAFSWAVKIHFFLFSLWRVFCPLSQGIVFFLGVFLWEDIRVTLLLLPLSFGAFLFSLFHHSLLYFSRKNREGVEKLLDVQSNEEILDGKEGIAFSLSSQAKKENYHSGHIETLGQILYRHTFVTSLPFVVPSGIFFFLWALRILSWLGLISFLYSPELATLGFTDFLKKVGKMAQPLVVEKLKIERYDVTKEIEKTMAKTGISDGKHSWLGTEVEKNWSRLFGPATHGQGPKSIPSKKVSPQDGDGEERSQRVVFAKNPVYVHTSSLRKRPLDEAFKMNSEVLAQELGEQDKKDAVFYEEHRGFAIKGSSPEEVEKKKKAWEKTLPLRGRSK